MCKDSTPWLIRCNYLINYFFFVNRQMRRSSFIFYLKALTLISSVSIIHRERRMQWEVHILRASWTRWQLIISFFIHLCFWFRIKKREDLERQHEITDKLRRQDFSSLAIQKENYEEKFCLLPQKTGSAAHVFVSYQARKEGDNKNNNCLPASSHIDIVAQVSS